MRVTDAGGHGWVIGTPADVAWITQQTSPSTTITSAIPPVFDAYATVVVPDEPQRRDKAILEQFLGHPDLEARAVRLGEEATPPHHRAF